MKRTLAAVALPLILAGCTAAPTAPVASSGSTADAAAAVETTEAAPAFCDATGAALVVRAWDRVVASVGASDHADMIDSLGDAVDAMEDQATDGCVGQDELEDLGIEVAVLDPDEAEESDYASVSEAGNAWLAALQEDGEFATATVPEKPTLTVSQEQAVSKAEDYLDYTAFSKSGLVKQLKYEGFSKKDAQFAVEHIEVDWNEQAAKKAKDYLEYTSFSRSGLIRQLKYEGFTDKQAKHGAKAVGL